LILKKIVLPYIMNPCLKRIILDISDIKKSPIEGAYYFPCEDNIMKGTALVIGPENTPYEYGNYLFSFEFTPLFPYEPPLLRYETNDGHTRFNPNFYRSGKVCLSILNTWPGERWSACQSIRSILITLQMTMNEYPLLNEPGVQWDAHFNLVKKYNKIIQYRNIEVSIIDYLCKKRMVSDNIYETMKQHFEKNKDKIMEKVERLTRSSSASSVISISIYSQHCILKYEQLKEKLNIICK